jgi:hypothetical protein
MIKGINSSGRYINITAGQPTSTYVNSFSGAQGVGNIRYNTSNQSMEVFDGNNWQVIAMNYAGIELTPDTESLLEWARLERTKQRIREERIEKNPALKKAYDAVKRAEANFELLESIAGNYNDQQEETGP